MNYREQYAPGQVNAVELCRLWSGPVDALERHLSANTWALSAVAVALIAYPIARIVIPAIVHGIVTHAIVPDAVRTVLSLI
ncbi:MAG TPA: hypothetical protein VK812_09425 [Candidatus Binatus sp.]|jgi:hypothetical protein|nr:hypothetical protein [Candidatus Binatus sp.]